jgi:hypothetical protein
MIGREIPITEEVLPLSKLNDHPRYQRKKRPGSLAKMMRKGLNPLAALILVVSRRTNGSLLLIDGGHRKDFLESQGEKEWSCFIAHGLKEREESDVWEDFNHCRTNARPIELLNAQIIAKNPEALTLQNIVHDCGYRFSFEEGQNGVVIDSVDAISTAKSLGFLGKILDALHMAWPDNREAVTGKMIHAMITFLRSLSDLKDLDFNRLVQSLRTFTPKNLLLKARESAELSNKKCSREIAKLIALTYNKGLRGSERIRGIWHRGVAEDDSSQI